MANPSLSSDEKKAKIEEKIKEILEILGLDLSNPSLSKTPARVAKLYVDDLFSGLDPENFPKVNFYQEESSQNCLIIKNIDFFSTCEHHLVPIIGHAHIAYLPQKKIIGFSKIHEIVRYFAKRPQLQERLTTQIVDALSFLLETEDVALLIRAKHFCVHLLEEEKDSTVETIRLKGQFQKEPFRSEFFSRVADESHAVCNVLSHSSTSF